jgi:hypothetical protein
MGYVQLWHGSLARQCLKRFAQGTSPAHPRLQASIISQVPAGRKSRGSSQLPRRSVCRPGIAGTPQVEASTSVCWTGSSSSTSANPGHSKPEKGARKGAWLVRDGSSGTLRLTGPRRHKAKRDFAIPSKSAARILIESKGYGATGSKQTDFLGDIRTIVAAKRPDTAFLFFTDGITWKERKSDLRQIVDFQNNGDITRIYTAAMADQFEADLTQLKAENKL